MAEPVNIVITATDNASKVIAGVSKTLSAVSSVVSDLTGGFMEYGAKIKDIAAYTGLTSEETSRMAQVFDDAGVSMETVSQVAKSLTMENAASAKEAGKLKDQIAALQKEMTVKPSEELRAKLLDLQNQLKNMTPATNLSIDTLARLSDEFLAIKDPVQQSIFLQEKFKRSGEDIAKVMRMGGDAIRENAKNVSDSLIIDDEKAKRIENTRVKLDEFNDRLQGLKYDAADKLLDIFDSMPQPLKDTVLTLGAVGQSGLLNQLSDMAILFTSLGKAGGLGTILTNIGHGAASLGRSVYAALGPVGTLAAALALLLEVIDKFGPDALETVKKLTAMGVGKVNEWVTGSASSGAAATQAAYNRMSGKASGGPVTGGTPYIVGERGPEVFVPSQGGSIIPNGAIGGNIYVFQLTYAPGVSLASQLEVEQRFAPTVLKIMREQGGRTIGGR